MNYIFLLVGVTKNKSERILEVYDCENLDWVMKKADMCYIPNDIVRTYVEVKTVKRPLKAEVN